MQGWFHAPHRVEVWLVLLTAGLITISATAQQYRAPDKNDLNNLLAAIEAADRVAVFRVSEMEHDKQVYSSSSVADLAALREAIHINLPKAWFRCACSPSPIIRLYQKGKILGSLEIYGGDDIHYSTWQGDAVIASPEPWFEWFDQRGIRWPRAEYKEGLAQEKARREAEERWVKAMPRSLVPLRPSGIQPEEIMNYDLGPLDTALSREFPDKNARIRSLLEWYGSGTGPWSGYPVYEEVAAKLLLEFSTAELLNAIESAPMNEQQIEGAARLLAGWDFRHTRPTDNALIPAELKRLLLDHSLKSTDQDKLQRARNAFAINSSRQGR